MKDLAVTPAPPADADGFLRTIMRSGLLDRDALATLLRDVPMEYRSNALRLADHLVKKGKLTRFQAGKLLQGTALGLVLGQFQILAPIARGGMGTVYLSRDNRSHQLLALKILPPRRAREEKRLLARFRREMEMSQRVSHPHIAWTCEVGLCQGVYYIAMEYIPGKSLHRLVVEEGPLAIGRLARLFSEITSGLEHAHQQGLIHRDLKPSNIMVTPNDHAKLLDLGLALVEGETCTHREVIGGQGYVVGTMDYLAPEQATDASQVDARSDLYSLGCTLYFALTGQPPFPGGTPLEKIHRHRSDQPTPIPQLNPTVPPAFIGLVRRLMAKKPQDRFASAAKVGEELLPWIDANAVLPLDPPGSDADVARLETVDLMPIDDDSQLPVAPLIALEELARRGQPGEPKPESNGSARRKRRKPPESSWIWVAARHRHRWNGALWAVGAALVFGFSLAGLALYLLLCSL